MKKGTLAKKWYWFIPIIGMIFMINVSKWIFDSDDFKVRFNRDVFITIFYTLPQSLSAYILLYEIFR